MLDADQWAEIRRLRRVGGMSIRGISRGLGLARETVTRPGRVPVWLALGKARPEA